MATGKTPKWPYKLVTVNTAPERAKRLIARMVEALKDRYEIIHAANCDSIDQVRSTVAEVQPDVLFCASMWTLEEAEQIQSIARNVKPNVVTYALPQGLQAEKGPDAVVSHLVEHVPQLLDSMNV